MHQPETMEGWEAWDLVLKGSGQIRFCHTVPTGFDLTALFNLATAIGYDNCAAAELLPACETGVIAALHEKLKD